MNLPRPEDPRPAGKPLPGTACEQFIYYGRPKCCCREGELHGREGELHGPYYRVWRDGRRAEKAHVGRAAVERVRGQCERFPILQEDLRALCARRVAITARLQAQTRRASRLRHGPPKARGTGGRT